MNNLLKSWWKWLRYEPSDPRFNTGGAVKIVVVGGGTGLATMLRGLKKYSNQITAIVAVTDDGGSSGEVRKEFDTLPPGDIRKCISALAHDEEMVAKVLEYRFSDSKKSFGGHTLGNIWITALSDHLGSFEKAVEVTTQIFQTSGKVLPATLSNVNLMIEYADGTTGVGESILDEQVKKIKKISLSKPKTSGYKEAILAINDADLIVLGPGSLYGSLIPNLLIKDIADAIGNNHKAVRIYAANCSTERTQTAGYSIEDHISAIKQHARKKIFDFVLVNNNILSKSVDDTKLGEVNNITTKNSKIADAKVVLSDIINEKNPLYHDPEKLAKAIIELYNKSRK